jgi:hypothetical protein
MIRRRRPRVSLALNPGYGTQRHKVAVRFDAVLELVVDRPELQVVLEILERGLDLDELDIELPQVDRISVAQTGAQQIC